MDTEIAVTLGVLLGALAVLVLELLSADVVLLAALVLLVIAGVLPLEDALLGFANPTLVALGSLYVIAAALRNTGALALAARHLLGRDGPERLLLGRLIVPVSLGSAFLNNTAIVAMAIPAVRAWCRRHRVSPSRLLIPLSYASIFGGMCTLMGTSTNLVTHGMLASHGMDGLGFFELAAVGLPCTLVGWAYLVFAAPRLLAERAERGDLGPATGRETHTVVVRDDSRLVGQTPRTADLLRRFNAEVEEVRRGGERVPGSVGDVKLKPGDTLRLDTVPEFRRAFEDSPEFYITSHYAAGEEERVLPSSRAQKAHMWAALAVLLAVVALAASGWLHIAVWALAGAIALVAGGVLPAARAREAVDWRVLLVIGAALGLGKALEASGAAAWLGTTLVAWGSRAGPLGLLAALLLATSVLTELITNNGAVALFFPIALAVATDVGIDPRPLVIAITAAASMSFATPVGYQTNLMVYSAGDYRFADFLRVGIPLQLVLMAVAVAVIPAVWPF